LALEHESSTSFKALAIYNITSRLWVLNFFASWNPIRATETYRSLLRKMYLNALNRGSEVY